MSGAKLETWLRPNRRALAWGLLPPLMVAALALWALLALGSSALGIRLVAGAVLALALGASLGLLWQMWLPRIGYKSGELLFYLRAGTPLRVPIEAVECFFIGQGPTMWPAGRQANQQTVTVVTRLGEQAKDYHFRDVKPALGSWCDGYIIIRGTWCEPLDGDRVNALNHTLAAAQRARKEAR